MAATGRLPKRLCSADASGRRALLARLREEKKRRGGRRPTGTAEQPAGSAQLLDRRGSGMAQGGRRCHWSVASVVLRGRTTWDRKIRSDGDAIAISMVQQSSGSPTVLSDGTRQQKLEKSTTALFKCTQIFKILQNSSPHRIFKRMHEILNIIK